MSYPSAFTRDQLRHELGKHKVHIPGTVKRKSDLLELYTREVGQRFADNQTADSVAQLSSCDTEEELLIVETKTKRKKSKPGSPRKPVSVKSSQETPVMDVYSLSDEQLLEQLKAHGIEFGPILDSTRRVYQKKLEKVLSGAVRAEPYSTADTLPVDDIEFSDPDSNPDSNPDEELDEPPAVIPRQAQYDEPPVLIPRQTQNRPEKVRQRPPPQPTQDVRQRPPAQPTQDYRSRPMTATSPLSRPPISQNPEDIVTQVAPPPPPPKKKGLSIWVQLLILILVSFLIFLVFQNMEPAAKLPTNRLSEEV